MLRLNAILSKGYTILCTQDYPADEQAVSDGLRDVLSLIRSDLHEVHYEGHSSLMDNGQSRPIPYKYQANAQVRFTAGSHCHCKLVLVHMSGAAFSRLNGQ